MNILKRPLDERASPCRNIIYVLAWNRHGYLWTSKNFLKKFPEYFSIAVFSQYFRYLASYRCKTANLPTHKIRIDASHTASITHIYCKFFST